MNSKGRDYLVKYNNCKRIKLYPQKVQCGMKARIS